MRRSIAQWAQEKGKIKRLRGVGLQKFSLIRHLDFTQRILNWRVL